jgi:hypothetical protein
MAEFTEAGLFTPLLHELAELYGKFIPEEDVLDIKVLIRKYFTNKYNGFTDIQFADMSTTRGFPGEWEHDPGK